MRFEEQFPSLKGKIIGDNLFIRMLKEDFKNKIVRTTYDKDGNFEGEFTTIKEPIIEISLVEKHCIDKQKVIEFLAIIKPHPEIMKKTLTEREIKNFQLHWKHMVKLAEIELGL